MVCAPREEEYYGGFPYRSRFRTSALSLGAARSKFVHRRGMLGACASGLARWRQRRRPGQRHVAETPRLSRHLRHLVSDQRTAHYGWGLAYLREVLRRDFLDLVRSKRARTSVYPDDERADGQELSESTIDQRVASYGNPEDEHLQSERLVWLVEQFKDDPELLEILRLQLEPAGYNAFSSQELAKRLSTTVVEIENRRRRVIRRLRKLADARLIEEAEHV